MIFVFRENERKGCTYDDAVNNLWQHGRKVYIDSTVIGEYGSVETAREAKKELTFRAAWADSLSQSPVAVRMPTEKELESIKKVSAYSMYTMVVYIYLGYYYEDIEEFAKEFPNKPMPVSEVICTPMGDTVEDFEKSVEKRPDCKLHYMLFENLNCKEIGNGEIDSFDGIKKDIKKYEKKKRKTYCTWQKREDGFKLLKIETDCGNVLFGQLFENFKYCPYCGRKIKMEE